MIFHGRAVPFAVSCPVTLKVCPEKTVAGAETVRVVGVAAVVTSQSNYIETKRAATAKIMSRFFVDMVPPMAVYSGGFTTLIDGA